MKLLSGHAWFEGFEAWNGNQNDQFLLLVIALRVWHSDCHFEKSQKPPK